MSAYPRNARRSLSRTDQVHQHTRRPEKYHPVPRYLRLLADLPQIYVFIYIYAFGLDSTPEKGVQNHVPITRKSTHTEVLFPSANGGCKLPQHIHTTEKQLAMMTVTMPLIYISRCGIPNPCSCAVVHELFVRQITPSAPSAEHGMTMDMKLELEVRMQAMRLACCLKHVSRLSCVVASGRTNACRPRPRELGNSIRRPF